MIKTKQTAIDIIKTIRRKNQRYHERIKSKEKFNESIDDGHICKGLIPDKRNNIDNETNDNIICEAYGCSKTALTAIVLNAGIKKIIVYVCEDCKSKFE